MASCLLTPLLRPPLPKPPPPPSSTASHSSPLFNFPLTTTALHLPTPTLRPAPRASPTDRDTGRGAVALDPELLWRVSAVKDADQALDLIAEGKEGSGGVVALEDCFSIIQAAFQRGNGDLALSVYSAMRLGFGRGKSENGLSTGNWKWDKPDARAHVLLIRGLAESLRVSDANRIIAYVSQAGGSPGDEVSFGKIVRCPTCMVAIAVAQPQHGIQSAACSKCCYQYELVSGNITSIESEEVSMDISAWERGLTFFSLIKKNIPAAIHSIVVRTPTGIARTHKFATKTVNLPAQEGERVTIALASASDVSREFGPIRFNARSPESNPGEPLSLTNHVNGQESELLRAPVKDGNPFLFGPSLVFPALVILASGDAASGFIDPTLPRLISIAALTSITLGTTINRFVLPRLNQLPGRIVDTVAIRQQLLSQYDMLQFRLRNLIQAAEKEVWMLARMCQLEKKIVAVGEPSYRARRNRIQRVREDLENSITARINLLESYAKISSMIEIEVEMDSDVLAAEAENNAERISEQLEQTMEMEKLEERCKIQAEANDEVERLLNSQPL